MRDCPMHIYLRLCLILVNFRLVKQRDGGYVALNGSWDTARVLHVSPSTVIRQLKKQNHHYK